MKRQGSSLMQVSDLNVLSRQSTKDGYERTQLGIPCGCAESEPKFC